MPRRPKQGIEFAGWSVDIFDGDTKVDKLLDAQGWVGFGIYFYLCQMAYKFDGYFYRWAYDDSASTARRMGGGVGSGTVEETVRYCLQIGLFDKGLFDRVGILTSKGIQRRFLAAIQGRRVKSVIADYWLLDDSESDGLDKCAKNDCLQTANVHLQETNTDLQDTYFPKSRVEESIVKESKGDITTSSLSARENPIQTNPAIAEVVSDFMDRINPMAPASCLQELANYATALGPEVCKRAFDIALAEKKTTWSYIRAILRNCTAKGIKCLADWDAAENDRENKKAPSEAKKEEMASARMARNIQALKRTAGDIKNGN